LQVIACNPGRFIAIIEPSCPVRFSLIMAPALHTAGETIVLNYGLAQPATPLLQENSGSSHSTGEAWLAALNPRLALISVGAEISEGNPAPALP
jgi:beta-lactamase superfamily II metal-dependent hydrolase